MIPPGWVQAVVTYKCKWCERTEVIAVPAGSIDLRQLDGWRPYDYCCGNTYDLCSSDCEKERDAANNEAYASLEPAPRGFSQNFFDEAVEQIRLRVMKTRGIKNA